MPQYPMPPWPDGQPPAQRRSVRLGMHNPRFAHLPVVSATADGTLTVLRGAPDLAGQLAEEPQTRQLYDLSTAVGEPHFVVFNRLGQVQFVHTDRPAWVGQVEFYQYTARYDPTAALGAVSSLDEVRDALAVEYERVTQLAADGWELIRVHDGPRGLLLVDTRRPDEDLTAQDLP